MDMDCTDRSVSRKVLTYEKGGFSSRSRELAQETCWTIMVGGNALETFSCSPWDLEQAALGILFFRDRVVQAEEVSQLTVYPEKGLMEAELTSLPPLSRKAAPHLTLRASQILELAAGLEEGAGLFRRTGGVHTAALARGREIFLRREDVSRHGALEKLAGACLSAGLPMAGTILVFSGRVSDEIVRMARKMGCGAIIARSAPTDLACQTAEEQGIILVGFARGESFNLYTCPNRVVP